MRNNRTQPGSSFQERDWEGRFDSPSGRGRYGRDYEDYDDRYDGEYDFREGRSHAHRYENDYNDYSGRRYADEDRQWRREEPYGGRGRADTSGRFEEGYDDWGRDSNWDRGSDRDVYNRRYENDDYDRRHFYRGEGRDEDEERGYDRDDDYARPRRRHTSGRGFASMDRNEVRRLASRGGRAAHENRSRDNDTDRSSSRRSNRDTQGTQSRDDSRGRRASGRGRQGFASMSREEVRRIASMGGKASHGGQGRDWRPAASRRRARGRSRAAR